MRKICFLLLMFLASSIVQAQTITRTPVSGYNPMAGEIGQSGHGQIVRIGVSAFSDNETNRTLTETASVTDTSNVLFTKTLDVGVMEADDSVGNYNYQYVRIGIDHNDGSNNIFAANIGVERLYSSTSDDRYQPIGYFAMGVSPTWSNSNPFGFKAYGRYSAFDEIGQYIRADIQVTAIGGVGEVYINQKFWIQGIVDESFLSDDNERFTTDLTTRYFTTSGFFYGVRGYYRTYKFDAGAAYWSPEQYGQLVGQVGYKFPWDNPNWNGSVTVSVGGQRVDNYDANFMGSAVADISRHVSSKVWVRGWGGYSNGLAIAGNDDGYRSWTAGLGVRVAR